MTLTTTNEKIKLNENSAYKLATSKDFAIQTLIRYESPVHDTRHIRKKIKKLIKKTKGKYRNLDLQAFTNIGITHQDPDQ
jgi:hypothetical protein